MQTSKRNYEKKILRLEDEIETQRQVLSTGLYLLYTGFDLPGSKFNIICWTYEDNIWALKYMANLVANNLLA